MTGVDIAEVLATKDTPDPVPEVRVKLDTVDPGIDREAAFQRLVERQEPYFAEFARRGDLAWFQRGHPRRAEVIDRLGLPEDISEMDLRRAFFARRYDKTQENNRA